MAMLLCIATVYDFQCNVTTSHNSTMYKLCLVDLQKGIVTDDKCIKGHYKALIS